MDLRCTTDRYAELYSRWLVNPGALLDLAEYQPGQELLDLCGGTGAVSLEALRRGAPPETITLMDLNPRCPDNRIQSMERDANTLGQSFRLPRRYDVVVCRQAVAYLDLKWYFLQALDDSLRPGGKFVFNTFNRPKWSCKTYKHENQRFFEVSGYWDRTVYHVQASPNFGFDVSRFHWYSEEDLRSRFGEYFHCDVRKTERSQQWICTSLATQGKAA